MTPEERAERLLRMQRHYYQMQVLWYSIQFYGWCRILGLIPPPAPNSGQDITSERK